LLQLHAESTAAEEAALEASGAVARRSFYLGLLAHLRAGRLAEGLAAVVDAQRSSLRRGSAGTSRNCTGSGASSRSRSGGAPEEARLAFEAALTTLANVRPARSSSRAAVRLARLDAEDGERRRARDLRAPVYGWFTEGFDTPDLKDARALLGALA
jgi:hypothetical protein